MNSDIDHFINNSNNFSMEMSVLRSLVLSCGLVEEFKWKQPCYTHKGKNILILSVFKNYSALAFFQGALLEDKHNLLEWAGENSQSVKLLKFTSVEQIGSASSYIKSYILEAIKNLDAGGKVTLKKDLDLFPQELETVMKSDLAFKTAFLALTKGRQRGYLLYFSKAKQSATISARIKKYTSRILNGKGINDCTCGLSRRMPSCDGSHNKSV